MLKNLALFSSAALILIASALFGFHLVGGPAQAGPKGQQSGVVLPSMTTAERDAITTPVAGQLLLNKDTGSLNYFTGSEWRRLVGEAISVGGGGSGGDSYEQNDSRASAYSLGGTTDDDDKQVVVKANFHSSDDEDWYKVHIEDTPFAALDPKVSLQVPTGHSYKVVLSFYCDGTGENFTQTQTVEQSSTVALDVAGCGGGLTGGEDSGDLYVQIVPIVCNSRDDYVLRING